MKQNTDEEEDLVYGEVPEIPKDFHRSIRERSKEMSAKLVPQYTRVMQRLKDDLERTRLNN